jgi:ribonuclease VapC
MYLKGHLWSMSLSLPGVWRPSVNSGVLDASALLAVLNHEPGFEVASVYLQTAVISSVNLSEVVGRLAAAGMPEPEIREAIQLLALDIISLDEEQAFRTGLLQPSTREQGLSLGDRACLALAQLLDAPAVTADRAWSALGNDYDVRLIR